MSRLLIAEFQEDEEKILQDIVNYIEHKHNIVAQNIKNESTSIIKRGSLRIDIQKRIVNSNGNNVELTNYEFQVLCLLAENSGRVFSKEQIYEEIWKEPCYGMADNVMSVIRRIRKKIEPDPQKPIYILTVWGMGYKFNEHLK